MGCVLPAGQGQAPARQAAIAAGLPPSVGAVTLNKVCGSGLKAVVFGANAHRRRRARHRRRGRHGVDDQRPVPDSQGAGRAAPRTRAASRFDDPRRPVGCLRQRPHGRVRRALCAREQDHPRGAGRVRGRIVPARARRARPRGSSRPRSCRSRCRSERGRRGRSPATRGRGAATSRSWRSLRPAFRKDGTITAGNASSINDGAAALVLAGGGRRQGARADADRAHRRLGRARAGARVVHDRARGRDRPLARARLAGASRTWISGRSTRRSRSCRW